MVLSTMQVHDELVASGMPEEQARAVVRVIERQQEESATKGDLDLQAAQMDARFARLESLIWRATAVICGVIVAASGVIIGAMAVLD